MRPAPQLKELVPVGDLLKRRLKETGKTPTELAEAVEVPEEYIADLISRRRRPPLPGRTDVYDRMTRFLGLGRNDLAACASAERAKARESDSGPDIEIRKALLELCEPVTAKELDRRGRKNSAEMFDLIQRLLGVVQSSVRRILDDPIALRLAAARNGGTYAEMRLAVLEFLDTTPDTLKPNDLTNYVLPRIERWDVDLTTGVLKVVLKTQYVPEQSQRSPITGRRGRTAS
jgi:plasmid maintenance system antidote protein VapI